jgi:hypothetical protein
MLVHTIGMEQWRIKFHTEGREGVIGGLDQSTEKVRLVTRRVGLCQCYPQRLTERRIRRLPRQKVRTHFSVKGVRLTKGVSLGPQINASHVKKSDSDIGPFKDQPINISNLKSQKLRQPTCCKHSIW